MMLPVYVFAVNPAVLIETVILKAVVPLAGVTFNHDESLVTVAANTQGLSVAQFDVSCRFNVCVAGAAAPTVQLKARLAGAATNT
jgi:hypothetical protein